jgi:hypothetical protein
MLTRALKLSVDFSHGKKLTRNVHRVNIYYPFDDLNKSFTPLTKKEKHIVKSTVKAGIIAVVCALTISYGQTGASATDFTKNALYCHPISLIVSTAVSELPLMLAVTYERSLKPRVSLVLTPSLLLWSLEESGDKLTATQFSIGVGLRRYLSKPTTGIFLQAKPNIGYASVNFEDNAGSSASASGFAASLLGMIGYKGQWDRIAMFIDVGLGYQYFGASASDVNSDIEMSLSGTGLAVGGDFTLGFCF